jgi:hypothetical protein
MNLRSAQPQAQVSSSLESATLSGPNSSESRVEVALTDLTQQIKQALHLYQAGFDLPKPLGTALIFARDAQLNGGPAFFRTCKAWLGGHAALVPSMHSAQSPELKKFLGQLERNELHVEMKPCFVNRRLFVEISVLHPSQLLASQ